MEIRIKIVVIFLLLMSISLFAVERDFNVIKDLPREKSELLDSEVEVVSDIKFISAHKKPKNLKSIKASVQSENGSKLFLNSARDKTKPLLYVNSEDEAHVVIDKRRNIVGIIHGTILLTVIKVLDVAQVEKDFPVRVIHYDQAINLMIVKVKQGNDIAKIVGDLKSDVRFTNVQLEVNTNTIKAK